MQLEQLQHIHTHTQNSPYTTAHSPAEGATDVAKNTTIVVHVKDDGAGVDITSIVMTVNGITVANFFSTSRTLASKSAIRPIAGILSSKVLNCASIFSNFAVIASNLKIF